MIKVHMSDHIAKWFSNEVDFTLVFKVETVINFNLINFSFMLLFIKPFKDDLSFWIEKYRFWFLSQSFVAVVVVVESWQSKLFETKLEFLFLRRKT